MLTESEPIKLGLKTVGRVLCDSTLFIAAFSTLWFFSGDIVNKPTHWALFVMFFVPGLIYFVSQGSFKRRLWSWARVPLAAGFLAAGVLLACLLILPHTPSRLWVLVGSWILAAVALVMRDVLKLTGRTASPSVGPERFEPSLQNPEMSAEEWRTWLANDKPIEKLDDDLFGVSYNLDPLAARIAAGEQVSVALHGEYGSGKTSFVNVLVGSVRKKLGESRKTASPSDRPIQLELVNVSLWGTNSEESASLVIEEMLRALRPHLDVARFRGLPEDYMAGIGRGEEWAIGKLMRLIHPRKSPAEVIRQIDEACEEANIILLVCIEDIDRAKDTETAHEAVVAFLTRLQGTKRISFILSTGTTGIARQTVWKVTSETIDVPLMRRIEFGRMLDSFRAEILRYDGGLIDPLPPQERRRLLAGVTSLSERDFLSEEDASDRSLAAVDAMNILMRTPRQFKRVLKQVEVAWRAGSIRGECDPDDLLVLAVLREWDPRSIRFIDRERSWLRGYQFDPNGDWRDPSKRAKLLKQKFLGSIRETSTTPSGEAMAAWNLVAFLFPTGLGAESLRTSVETGKDGSSQTRGAILPPQRVELTRPCDYLDVALRGRLEDGSVRDQVGLRFLEDWKNSNYSHTLLETKLAEFIEGPPAGDLLAHFLPWIVPEQHRFGLVQTAAHLISAGCGSQLLDNSPREKATHGQSFLEGALLGLSRISVPALDDVIHLVEELTPRDVFISCLCRSKYPFRSNEQASAELLSRFIEAVRRRVRVSCSLAAVLDSKHKRSHIWPYLLRHFVVLDADQRRGGRGAEQIAEWSGLLDPPEETPDEAGAILLPQYFHLLTDRDERDMLPDVEEVIVGRPRVFNTKRLDQLFPGEGNRQLVLAIMKDTPIPDWLDADSRDSIERWRSAQAAGAQSGGLSGHSAS